MAGHDLIFFHAPQSRSGGVRVLFEELGVPYELRVLNLRAGDSRKPEFLAVNPMGKVPAILHKGALVTEQTAVYLYLADLFPEAGLGPRIGDPLRGPFLRWLAFHGSTFEPALLDRAFKREAAPRSTAGYGDYESMIRTLTGQLREGPWILGETFSAADILWGAALHWTTMFGIVEADETISAYVARYRARPSVARAQDADAALLASFPPQPQT